MHTLTQSARHNLATPRQPQTQCDDVNYDQDIANDMRELELRLQDQLEEWSGDDSPKWTKIKVRLNVRNCVNFTDWPNGFGRSAKLERVWERERDIFVTIVGHVFFLITTLLGDVLLLIG